MEDVKVVKAEVNPFTEFKFFPIKMEGFCLGFFAPNTHYVFCRFGLKRTCV